MTHQWTGDWHPLAARFPMLPETELRELADSITAHGQYVPCRMSPDGLGLDGRNRVAACALAGVEAAWEVYEGDAIAFIVEVNADRRHLTTGQRAMAVAIGLVEAGARANGRFKRGRVPAVDHERDGWRGAIWKAGLVLDHAPELADQVLAGEITLEGAHKQSDDLRQRKDRLQDLDEQFAGLVLAGVLGLEDAEARVRDEARTATLADDLAARVRAGTLELDEAEIITTDRDHRLDVWAQDVRRAIDVMQTLAGHPVPAGLLSRLDAAEQQQLELLLRGVPQPAEEHA